MQAIHIMNLKHVDLNLLVVFDAIMTERNVTRAGERIGLSQPAASNALARLRRMFNDELFLRTPKGMRPTLRAVELAEPIMHALREIDGALQPAAFDPARSRQTFRLAMADYLASVILPPLARRLQETAPGVNLHVRPNDNVTSPALLDANEIDIAIGNFSELPERFCRQELLAEEFVCVMRRGHPLAASRITLKQYAAAKHLLISLTGQTSSFIDGLLKTRGLERRIVLIVNHILVAPPILERSDFVTTLTRHIACAFVRSYDLRFAPLPLAVDPAQLTMLWHGRFSTHPAHEWMRSLLLTTIREA
jgi:DNA-binding transcriptional LysR family regulator